MEARNAGFDGVSIGAMNALENLSIELPSWGFANTGTRFGKYLQPGAATTLEEKFADAAQVNALTGITPQLALHVQWDFPAGIEDAARTKQLAAKYGVRPGSINPNLFQDQEYKFGSICNPDPGIRRKAVDHLLESVEIAKALGSRDVSLWIADGSNYPGAQSIRKRIGWLQDALKATHDSLDPGQRMLVEYKPFEPAFYHTDVADWGMAVQFAQTAGPQARVLVDTGHHYQAQNIEQIVAWLLHLRLLGGFHFNDRRYADDDLTIGSIDPYQVFRIFHEIFSEPDSGGLQRDRLHDRSKPQHKGQNGSDGSDRGHCPGVVSQGGDCRSRPAGRVAVRSEDGRGRGVPAYGFLDRCASRAARVAAQTGPA